MQPKMKNAKAQSSVESALLISFMMLVFVVFMLAVTDRIVDLQEKRDKELLQDIGFVIANELKIAAAAENGYQRTFSVLDTIKGKNFSVVLVDSATMGTNFSELTLKYINQTLYFEDVITLPVNIKGSLVKGGNNLIKRGGIVEVNP